jgi:1-deoxy-D-xylulose-5-phosphate reductoisomerase
LTELSGLHFETVRHDAFPALNLARKASVEGDDRPIILNAANEIAVEAFLNDQISFTEITEITADCLNQIAKQPVSSINDVLSLDNMCRTTAQSFISECK